ncbi:hypothetical protein ES708_10317 [subsurface metagenome]
MVVPVSLALPTASTAPLGMPFLYFCWYCLPSRRTLAVSQEERALTTEAPTPCSPPETT